MSWVCGLLILLWLLDALRLRARLSALQTLPDSTHPVAKGHRFVRLAGMSALDEETARAASAWAQKNNLEVLDLVPHNLDATRAMRLAQAVDAKRYRDDPFAAGVTAGHIVLIDQQLLDRFDIQVDESVDRVALFQLVDRLKSLAPRKCDIAVAPSLTMVPISMRSHRGLLRSVVGALVPTLFGFQTMLLALVVVGIALTPVWGLLALATFQLQPLLVTLGTELRPRDLLVQSLFRLASETTLWGGASFLDLDEEPDEVAALRPTYAALIEDGTEPFFESRRNDCPACNGKNLTLVVRTTDLFQFKPGIFHLERCGECGHLFQNPRLSLEGLGYYYRDFYDGLGARTMRRMFAVPLKAYGDRARSVPNHPPIRRWLDVGGGHGHFCLLARDVIPSAQFDGLDMSVSIEEAHKRNWVDVAHRGSFPELAAGLAQQYDAVSMSHYLEHTREPGDEIDAAHKVLREGGHLMIEVPNTRSIYRQLFGKLWMPYLQPQHQHFFSPSGLARLLEEHGFEPVQWWYGRVHTGGDWAFFPYMRLGQLAPGNYPWRPPSRTARLWRGLVWSMAGPLLFAGLLLEKITRPFAYLPSVSNAVRVVARKRKVLPP